MQSLLVACRYLTVLPLPSTKGAGDLGRAAGWFPVVGLALGGLLVLAGLGADRIVPPPVSAALVVALWAALTGGLHLDGLGDALDGLGGGWSREQALRIMRAGGIGAYGVTGIVLVLALKVAVLGSLSEDYLWRALVAAPVLGRLAPLLLARLCPPARPDGAGRSFALTVGTPSLVVASGVAGLVSVVCVGVWGLGLVALALASAAAFAGYLRRRLGGLTGDCLGALVEAMEAAMLAVCGSLDYLGVTWGVPWSVA